MTETNKDSGGIMITGTTLKSVGWAAAIPLFLGGGAVGYRDFAARFENVAASVVTISEDLRELKTEMKSMTERQLARPTRDDVRAMIEFETANLRRDLDRLLERDDER